MNLYAPQTEIGNPWKYYILLCLGFWFAVLGVLAWWANYLELATSNITTEWTAEQKQKSLELLSEKAKRQGVVEPTFEEKMQALQGRGARVN